MTASLSSCQRQQVVSAGSEMPLPDAMCSYQPTALRREAAGNPLTRWTDLKHFALSPLPMDLEKLQQLLETLVWGWQQRLACGLGRVRLKSVKPQLDHGSSYWDPQTLKPQHKPEKPDITRSLLVPWLAAPTSATSILILLQLSSAFQ